ncbi:YesL family protein [Bacillus sp. P14.5]|uniref:YesL family protein n=1 Tax=Bacillus sp. P14.5 TaxID=1983400 RepID=UPI000DEA1A2C|nr:YesL family protein [Bacillus sp. P14.5]
MEFNGALGGIYRVSEWVTRLAYVNILWLLFTLAGALIFGFMPASISMFAVIRKWCQGDFDFPVFNTFWNTYKSEFWRSNKLGVLLFLAPISFYLNYQIFQLESVLYSFSYLLFPAALFYLFIMFYIFPLYVHFQMPLIHYIKNSLLMAVSSPVSTFLLIVSCSANYYILSAFPGLGIIFLGSTTAYILTFVIHRRLHRIEFSQGQSIAG